jgi:hypothetical protein
MAAKNGKYEFRNTEKIQEVHNIPRAEVK